MKDKLIFLDIDGVVNTLMISNRPFKGQKRPQKDGFYFDLCSPSDNRVSNKQAIMWLNKLCIEVGAKIIISSTWRRNEFDWFDAETALKNSGLFRFIEIAGATPKLGTIRGKEIQAWLNKHYSNNNEYDFIILDDDADMGELLPHLIQCDTDRGFGYKEYRKAYEKLI